MVMMFAPVGQGKRDLENSLKNEADAPAKDAETSKADEDGTNTAKNQEGETAKQDGEGEAYEGMQSGGYDGKFDGIAEDGYRTGVENIEANTRNIEEASFTSENIEAVREHLSNDLFLEPNGDIAANNQVMIERLEAIENGTLEPTPTDQAFITHELREAQLMNEGMIYEEAHAQTCKEYGFDVQAEKNNPFYTQEAMDAWNQQIMNNLGL